MSFHEHIWGTYWGIYWGILLVTGTENQERMRRIKLAEIAEEVKWSSVMQDPHHSKSSVMRTMKDETHDVAPQTTGTQWLGPNNRSFTTNRNREMVIVG